MIKFFRKIRQKLLEEGKIKRYLIYAIGEILLVMIGILLALQVNNWNDKRIQLKLEKSLLTEMIGNLNQDLSDLEDNLNTCKRFLNSNNVVLTQLDNQVPYHDSMEYHYGNLWGNTLFMKNTSAFENLESLGFNIISNDSLRKEITNLYSGKYNYLAKIESLDNKYQFDQLQPELRKHIRMDALWNKAYPINPEKLMKNHEFKEVIRFNITTRQFVISIYDVLISDILKLIKLVNNELNK